MGQSSVWLLTLKKQRTLSNSFAGPSSSAQRTDLVEQPSERKVCGRALFPSYVNYNRVRFLHVWLESSLESMVDLTR